MTERALKRLFFAGASLAAHLALALTLHSPPPPFESTTGGDALTTTVTMEVILGTWSPVERSGGYHSAAGLDTGLPGEGASADGEQIVRLASDRHDVMIQTRARNAHSVDQLQRIKTGRRTSPLHRRATPNPAQGRMVITGRGRLHQRLDHSPHRTGRGQREAPARRHLGNASPAPAGHQPPRPSGKGFSRSAARESHAKPAIARQRPDLEAGLASTFAQKRGRVNDDRNAERLAAQAREGWMQASPAMGPTRDHGPGAGMEKPGQGNRGTYSGARAQAFGNGAGPVRSFDRNPEYMRWFSELKRRVVRHLKFPRARLVAMDQGTSVHRFVVLNDGRLRAPPKLIRSSGFRDLDRASARAIAEASPLPQTPRGLTDSGTLEVTLRIEHSNPMFN